MSGGFHIRAIGPDNAISAPEGERVTDADPLALQEDWVAGEPAEDVWEGSPQRSFGWLAPVLAFATVAAWTGFFGWANLAGIVAGANAQQWSALIVQWTVPVLLVVALWLLAMRHSRREAHRFGDAAHALRSESIALEDRLSVINRELSLAREFLAAQTRELESLGRVATSRLSEHADRLQSLVHENGAQVEVIADVSRTALDNMERLRGDLPVIANAARDVTSQIGNAGQTAQVQLDEMVSGFTRLNEFGQASERQVASLRSRVDAALGAFTAQAAQLDDIAGERFAALRERSEEFRTELDGREVDVLAAMRHRADRLRDEVAETVAQLEQHEEELLKSLQARVSGMRESAATVGASLADGERGALAAWRDRVAALRSDLIAAIGEVEAVDKAAKEGAQARLATISDEAALVDDKLARSHTEFVEAVEHRRAEVASIAAEQVARMNVMLGSFDTALAERRAKHIVQAAELVRSSEALGERMAALGTEMDRAAQQGQTAKEATVTAIDALAARLNSSRDALATTDTTIAGLTDASIRLLELIQASADHTRTVLPQALTDAETRLVRISEHGEALGLMLDSAGERGREISQYVIDARTETSRAGEEFQRVMVELARHHADQRHEFASLRQELQSLGKDADAAAERTGGALRTAIEQLSGAARDALAALDSESPARVGALAERIGDHAAGAIDRVLEQRMIAAVSALDEAAERAGSSGRDTAILLRDQLARVNELAGNLENRVAHARQQAEEQVDADFSRRVALLTESLNSNAIDIAKALSTDVTDTAWASYLRGDRGIFTRRAVRLLDPAEARQVTELYESEPDFAAHVNRYIHDFEAMLRTMLSTRDGHAIGVTLLSSDMGKLYVALAQAIERLRA